MREQIFIEPGSDEWLLLDAIRGAQLLSSGQATRLQYAQEAFSRVADLVRDALPANCDAGIGFEAAITPLTRDEILEGLRFLRGASVAARIVAQLQQGLEELDRGVEADWLTPAPGGRRGGKTPTRDLYLKSLAVIAADELQKTEPKIESYRAALKQVGFSARTIDGYRQQVLRGPHDFSSQLGYLVMFGEADPIKVLSVIYSDLRREKGR